MMDGLSYTAKMDMVEGKSADVCGITIYPLTMRDYGVFQNCKAVLTLRQSTLPVAYISMPYLQALFSFDRDNQFEVGLMGQLILLLAKSTRKAVENFKLLADKNDHTMLGAIAYEDEETSFRITPAQYGTIRQTIAQMNRERIPDESENAELLEAQRDIESMRDMGIEADETVCMESVANQYRIRTRELMDWTIYEFIGAIQAIDRDKLYMLCSAAEYGGMVKFKSGNPCPCWQYNKRKDSSVLEPISALGNRLGLKQ